MPRCKSNAKNYTQNGVFLLRSIGEALILKNGNYINSLCFLNNIGLFRRRVRPRHEILVNLDLAIQDCQREINDSEKELKKSVAHDQAEFDGTGVVKSGTSTSHYYQLEKSFEKLKERLLKNIKDI